MSEGGGSFLDRGPSVLAVTTTTLIIASIFVFARLTSRIVIVKHITWDDYFIALGWLLAFGLSFAINYGTSKGLGRHDVDIPVEWLPALLRSEYAFSVLYNPALMATKTSILIFYLRLARNTNRLLRIASYVTLGVVNLAGIVLTFLNVFQCNPVSAVFNPSSDSQCTPLITLYLASAPINIITDLTILVLPLPVLTGMHLPQKQKTVLVVTFLLGIFVTVVDVVRIYYLQQASDFVVMGEAVDTSGTRIGSNNSDFAWYASLSLMWTAVEVNMGIICACVPTLKPLVSKVLPKLIDHRSGSESMSSSLASETAADQRGQSMETNAIQPLPAAVLGRDQEAEMRLMDFLTTPGMDPEEIERSATARTQATENTTYFGFVNIRRPKSMLKTRGKDAFKYCTIVTILFFLWGFSYGLLNTLNSQISAIFHSSESQSLGLQSTYFGAYLIGPLTVGQFVLRHGGFKATFITGLCIYGIGTLCFWPSAVLTSFPGFVVSQFIVAFGLSVLETAANPFLVLCGPPEHGETRLLTAQGVQAIGSVVSPLLAEKALFKRMSDGSMTSNSLIDVQWTYLAIALFDVILALFFYYMPLPEATDDDLAAQCEPVITNSYHDTTPSNSTLPKSSIFTKRMLLTTTLVLAVMAQFVYVAAQESLSIYFEPLISTWLPEPSLTASNAILTGHATFAIGRFLAAVFCLFVTPRIILLISFATALIMSILVFALNSSSASAIEGLIIVLFAAEGPLFPLIFAIGLRKQGRRTKWAAAALTAGASGGAVFPWVMYAVQHTGQGGRVHYSYSVLVALFAAGLVFPIWLCAVPGVRKTIDPELQAGNGAGLAFEGLGTSHLHLGRKMSSISRINNGFSSIISKIKDAASTDGVMVEHRERRRSKS